VERYCRKLPGRPKNRDGSSNPRPRFDYGGLVPRPIEVAISSTGIRFHNLIKIEGENQFSAGEFRGLRINNSMHTMPHSEDCWGRNAPYGYQSPRGPSKYHSHNSPYPHRFTHGGHWLYGPYPPAIPQPAIPDPPPTSGYYAPLPPPHFLPPTSTDAVKYQRQPPVVHLTPDGPNKGDNLVYEVVDSDVLCGRGAPTAWVSEKIVRREEKPNRFRICHV